MTFDHVVSLHARAGHPNGSIGGPKQGAQVTAFGREILASYKILEKRLLLSMAGDFLETLTNNLLSAPDQRRGASPSKAWHCISLKSADFDAPLA